MNKDNTTKSDFNFGLVIANVVLLLFVICIAVAIPNPEIGGQPHIWLASALGSLFGCLIIAAIIFSLIYVINPNRNTMLHRKWFFVITWILALFLCVAKISS